MPDMTSNFAIRYPCVGETIDAGTFQDFADDVENALALTEGRMTAALNRPAGRVQRSLANQNFVVNVTTDMTYDTEVFDNDGLGNLGVNNDRMTIVSAGVYLAKVWISQLGGWTTITSTSVIISQNGVARWQKKGPQGATVPVVPFIACMGLLDCAVGDIIRGRLLWTGTVGPATAMGELELTLIAEIP